MKVLYIGDNRNRGNYGCRATSTALSMLISRKNEITGVITGKSTSQNISDLFFYSPLPKIAYSFFGKHTFLRDIVKEILHRFKIFSHFGSFDFVSLNFDKSISNLKKCIVANPQLKELIIDQYDYDAVVVNGEGSFIFGSPQWREPLVLTMLIHWAIKKGKPVYLTNVMFSDSKVLPHNQASINAINSVIKNCSKIIVREKTSYNYIRKYFKGIEPSIIPDALFSWHSLITEAPTITNGRYCLAHSAEKDEAYFNQDFTKPYLLIAGSSAFVQDKTKSVPAYTQLVNKLKSVYKNKILLIQNLSVSCDGYYLPRNELPTVPERVFRRSLQSSAARHFHSDNRNALDVVILDDLGQLFGVIHHIELRAADQGDFTLHKILVHIRVGIGGAVGGNQQLCAVVERSLSRQQFNLDRPLVQP